MDRNIIDATSVVLELVKANIPYRTPTTSLTNKKLFIVHNKSDETVYYGGYNVTVENGVPLKPQRTISIKVSGFYFVSPTAGKKLNIIILEL